MHSGLCQERLLEEHLRFLPIENVFEMYIDCLSTIWQTLSVQSGPQAQEFDGFLHQVGCQPDIIVSRFSLLQATHA